MLTWVMPWLIGRALYALIDAIISGTNKIVITPNYLYSLGLARVIVSGAFWCLALYGFTKAAAMGLVTDTSPTTTNGSV